MVLIKIIWSKKIIGAQRGSPGLAMSNRGLLKNFGARQKSKAFTGTQKGSSRLTKNCRGSPGLKITQWGSKSFIEADLKLSGLKMLIGLTNNCHWDSLKLKMAHRGSLKIVGVEKGSLGLEKAHQAH